MPLEKRRMLPRLFQQNRFGMPNQAVQRSRMRVPTIPAQSAASQQQGIRERQMKKRLAPRMAISMQALEPREKYAPTAPFVKSESLRTGWSAIPILGSLIDLLRDLIFPQERFREAKRLLPASRAGIFAKTAAERAKARMQARVEQKQRTRILKARAAMPQAGQRKAA